MNRVQIIIGVKIQTNLDSTNLSESNNNVLPIKKKGIPIIRK